MLTAVEMIVRARESPTAAAEDRTYNRGATGTPQGGQFATGGGSPPAGKPPTQRAGQARRSAHPVAKKKPAVKKAPTTLDQAATRQYANFGRIGEHTPSGDQRVKDLQALMSGLGMKTAVDGNYGPNTTAAVKAMQTKLGVKPTGHVTSSLMKQLQSAAILSPCAKVTEGVMFTAADLMRRAREGFNPDQKRAPKGTGIGGRFVSMHSVITALKGAGHHDAAASLAHLDTPSVPGHHGPTHRPSSHTPRIARGGDRTRAEHLSARLAVLDDQHAARLHAGSPMLDPEARRQNRLKAEQLHAELAPVQGRVSTEDAIKADNLETRGVVGDVPAGDHLEAARAHVAAMQGGKPASDPVDAETRAVQLENRAKAAYQSLGGNGGWVGVADMRDAMPDLSREEQDIALRRLAMGQFGPSGSRVIPIANSKGLSDRDRAAALRMGGQEHHAVSIENSSPTPLPGAAPSAPAVSSYDSRKVGGQWGVYAISPDGSARLAEPAANERAANNRAGNMDAALGSNRAPRAAASPAAATPTKAPAVPRKLTTKDLEYSSPEQVQQAFEEGRVSPTLAARRMRRWAEEMRQWASHGRMGSTMGHGVVGGKEPSSPELVANLQHRVDLAAEYDRMADQIEAKPAKPTAAAKMARAKASVDHASIADQVKAAQSEDDVRALLQGQKLTVADLKTIAGHVGGPSAAPKGTKQQMIDKIAAGSAGLKNRPASIFAGDWNTGTSAPSTPSAPSAPDAAELERRRLILAAPLAQPRAMRPEDGIGVFSADPEVQRRAAAALNAATPDLVDGTPVTARVGDRPLFGSAPSRIGEEPPITPERKVEVENAIRQAYLSSDRSVTGWAMLADVRERLGGGYSRQEVDDAFARMSRQQGSDRIVLTEEANQKTLTPRTRSAAVILGNQDKHAVLIQDASPRPGGSTSAPSTTPRPTAAQKMTRAKATMTTVGADPLDVAERIDRAPNEDAVLAHMEGMTVADLRKVARNLSMPLPKPPDGGRWTPDALRRYIASVHLRDRQRWSLR